MKLNELDLLRLSNLSLKYQNKEQAIMMLKREQDEIDIEYKALVAEIVKKEGKTGSDIDKVDLKKGEITFKAEVPVSGSITKVQKAAKKR